jgi:hypothetical protein
VPDRSPILIGLVGSIVTVAMVPISAFATLFMWLDTCDGDGGYPYSARASVAGRFCDSSFSMPLT